MPSWLLVPSINVRLFGVSIMSKAQRVRFSIFGVGLIFLALAMLGFVNSKRVSAQGVDVLVPGNCVGAVACPACVPYTICTPWQSLIWGWYCNCVGGNDGWQPGVYGLCDWTTGLCLHWGPCGAERVRSVTPVYNGRGELIACTNNGCVNTDNGGWGC